MAERGAGGRQRRPTATSAFGAGRREGHDATAFYARFPLPELSDADDVVAPYELPDDGCFLGDSRHMTHIVDGSVALVVTSPPYFAGKEYEEALGQGHIPGSYVDYLELLHDVFAECVRTLEPGGRIAVNVANLGRKPYRSLSGDVTRILEELGLLLRGEVIWRKADGAGGNCAWGSFGRPANPVLRDLTERVIIASKGRFDRAKTPEQRRKLGLPHEPWLLTNDEFMAATLDVWEIPPESARRVQHPAPFPVELPERLIRLYTYRDDLVLDPFMGSGSALVAAARTGRRWAGYDMDPDYVRVARERVNVAMRIGDVQSVPRGMAAKAVAEDLVARCGFTVVAREHRVRNLGLAIDLVAEDGTGVPWHFDLTGAFTTTRGGLARRDVAWQALGRAQLLARHGIAPVVLLTSALPARTSDIDRALRAAGPHAFFDAIEMLSPDGEARLSTYGKGGHDQRPLSGFWRAADLTDPLS
jgi:DNA modification methylase